MQHCKQYVLQAGVKRLKRGLFDNITASLAIVSASLLKPEAVIALSDYACI